MVCCTHVHSFHLSCLVVLYYIVSCCCLPFWLIHFSILLSLQRMLNTITLHTFRVPRNDYLSAHYIHRRHQLLGQARCNPPIFCPRGCPYAVAKVFWTCVLQVQRKFWSDSVHVMPLETAGIINVEMISYCGPMSHGTRGCLAWVRWGPRSGGSALLVVGFSVLVSILLCSLSMSRAALSTRLMMALSLRGSRS